ncbi:hypothetical protein FH972_022833 [Carpinus fangiana]|nr:hypothetical protein FH972_022833 [Carpinus fangiana]
MPPKPSTNPFLDNYKADAPQRSPRQRPHSPLKQVPPPINGVTITADQLDALALNEKSQASANNARSGPSHGIPLRDGPKSAGPSNGARFTADEERRRRMQGRGPPPTLPVSVFADLDRSENRRPRARRNSDSSVMDVKSAEDEERKRRERRREKAAREGKDDKDRSRRPNKKLDLIDRLDLTGMYGGAAFHHDGPFDACRPHRNRKGRLHAPMQAFPEGSANNALGGSGPVNKGLDYDHYHGRQGAAFTDFSNIAAQQIELQASRPKPSQRTESFNATDRVEQVHGDPSLGLGTSTFLEGAPASRAALQRRQSESEGQASGGGLQRKKSLAAKLRNGIKARPSDRPAGYGEASKVVSPDTWPKSPPSPLGVQSAGGRTKMADANPFFTETSPETTKVPVKGSAKVPTKVVESSGTSLSRNRTLSDANAVVRVRTTSSPNRGTRSSGDSFDEYGNPVGTAPKATGSGGFLNRVKSIKGKRSRPERSVA